MAVKNVAAKVWSITPSSDGKRWSAWPAGDRPNLTGLIFPGNASSGGDIRMRWTGAARLSRTSCTVLCRANYTAQDNYYAKIWFDGTPGTWDYGAWSVGAHPYPTSGSYNPVSGATTGGTGSTHYYEIAGLGGGDFIATGDPGGVPQGALVVTKGVWKREAFKIETVGGTTLRHTYRPDVVDNASFSIVQDYPLSSIGSPSSPAFYFGAASWRAGQPSAGRNDETPNCILRGIALFSEPLSDAHCDAILALDTDSEVLAYCSANSITSLWYLNMNPTPTDISDKSGNGRDPSWNGTGSTPTLWTP